MLLPHQRSKLARGTKDKKPAMSQNLNIVAVIGIDALRQCPLWVISGQTIASQKPAFVRFGPKADKLL